VPWPAVVTSVSQRAAEGFTVAPAAAICLHGHTFRRLQKSGISDLGGFQIHYAHLSQKIFIWLGDGYMIFINMSTKHIISWSLLIYTYIYIHVLLDISRYRDMFCSSRLRTGSEVQLSNNAPRLSDEAKATTSVRKLLAVSYFLRLVSRTKKSGFSPWPLAWQVQAYPHPNTSHLSVHPCIG
jgi:hypothetical protein